MNASAPSLQQLAKGLWYENPGLVQLLGLCPLLAVTTSLVNGFGLGVATLFVLTLSNLLVSMLRGLIRPVIRVPLYVLVIASLVTCAELLLKAWLPDLDRSLGIFVPLIVTNCAIVARAEVFASRNPPLSSMVDGIGMGVGFAIVLCIIGAFRELLGSGTLLGRLDLLGIDGWSGLQLFDGGFLLLLLPPGAFFSLALLIAGKNALDNRRNHAIRAAKGQQEDHFE
ncbi:MAG TPA: electron transport complex subunit E [Woeseiaceae bacterium]